MRAIHCRASDAPSDCDAEDKARAKHYTLGSEYEFGELDCEVRKNWTLKGLNGGGFIDSRKQTAVSGHVDVELVYKVSPSDGGDDE